jgi:hypothetical protein
VLKLPIFAMKLQFWQQEMARMKLTPMILKWPLKGLLVELKERASLQEMRKKLLLFMSQGMLLHLGFSKELIPY